MECLEWEPGSAHFLWPTVAPSFPQTGEEMQSQGGGVLPMDGGPGPDPVDTAFLPAGRWPCLSIDWEGLGEESLPNLREG